MATISVPTSQALSAVTYAARDVVDVLDGALLTIDEMWTIKPALIQLLGTGRVQAINPSTSAVWVLEFDMGAGGNSGGFTFTQNAQVKALGDWIVVGASTGANNQVLFNCNSVGGQAIDYPTYIEVETGSATDVWEIWQAIPEDVPGGTANTLGFNSPNTTAGTVAVAANGTVTGTGTAFTSSHPGMPFKLPGIARDFVVATFSTATSIVIQELDGSTYTGGVIAAGSTYILRTGSLISPSQVGSGDLGKVLFFNPLTRAVRMGDNVNGTKLLTGARVRIPNIHFNSARQQTTLATAITGTGAQAFTLAAAIGPASAGTYNAITPQGTLLLINGSNVERIFYSSRSGAVVSATGMARGAAGTVAQASFPVGTQVYWIPTNQNNINNAAFNPSPSGSVDLQVCSVGLRMNATFSNFGSMVVKKFGYSTIFNAGNCSGTFDIDGLSCLGAGFQNPLINGGIAAQFSALLGVGSIKNVNVTNNLPGATSYSNIALGNVQGLEEAGGYRSRHFGRATNANGSNLIGVSLQTVKCATPITNVYAAGSSVRWNALTDVDTANIHISALPNANSLGSGDTFIPIFGVGITDSTIRDFRVWDGGLATRSSLISIDQASSKVVCHNKGSPVINGGGQISSIIADVGLDTTLAHFSVSNPRTTTFLGVLSGNVAFGRGGRQVMNLMDSINATGLAGSGQPSKGGLEIDVMAGPYRTIQTNPAGSIIPNLTDVQPIIVMSSLDKSVGSVYVGAFTAEGSFEMYDLIGEAYLDNLGRILYPGIGDGAVIKSVFAIKGISNFTGSAFDFNYNLGAGTNPVPVGTTLEFRLSNWGTPNTGAWLPFVDNASLETARAALAGFSSSRGIDLQLRIIATTAQAGRYLMSLRFPATIDPDYDPPVGYTDIGVSGAQPGTLVAGYLNAEPSAPEMEASLTLTGTSGSVPMPYDYDNVPVDYRLVARKAGWTFSSLTGTYKKTAISIPITQLEVLDINGTPLYAAGVTGVAVVHAAQTITVSASRSAAQVWSAVQDNLCLLQNLTKADPFSTSNGAGFFSSYTLVVTGSITAGNISSNVTLTGTLASGVVITGTVNVGAAGVLASGVQINGDVIRGAPANISNVVINGALEYTPTAAATYTQTNCEVGIIRNNNPEAGTITVRQIGGSILGSAEGINIVYPVTISRTGGGVFNLIAQIVTDGEVTQDLGYQANATSFAADVPLGSSLQLCMWSLGYVSFVRSYSISESRAIEIDLIAEPDVDITLSVAAYLANISVTYSGATFTATFLANMLIDGIEPVKAIVHRLLGQESPMRALLPPGTDTMISIEADEIQMNKPAIFLRLGAAATDVQVLGYFNTEPAKIVDPTYVINPRRADNLRVEMQPKKPDIDADQLALAVLAKLQANTIPVNVAKVKGYTINGEGTEANPWGP